jgi:hypothetical protein
VGSDHDLWRRAEPLGEEPAHQLVEQLVGADDRQVRIQLARVVALQHGVQQLVQVDLAARRDPGLEHVPLDQPRVRDLGEQPQKAL